MFNSGIVSSAFALVIAGSVVAQPVVPADPEPQWWKGNLHTHTFWSDGNDFPEMVAQWYVDNGYNFLALSDHNVVSQGERWMPIQTIQQRSRGSAFSAYIERFGESWVETRGDREGLFEVRLKPFDEYRALVESRGGFIMIQAEEITDGFEGKPIHINATNIAGLIDPTGGDSVEDTIRKNLIAIDEHAREHGREVLPHLNHPNFGYGVRAEDLAPVLEEQFFEVFNGHTGVRNDGDDLHASTDRMWDIMNAIRMTEYDAPPMYGIATDDSHNYHGHSPVSITGRGWVMVRARHLTPESIVRAMKAGDFYSSSGVELASIEFDASNRLRVRIVPVEGETYTTRFIGTLRGTDVSGEPVLDAQGNAVEATLRYSPHVGEVLAQVEGTLATYVCTGEELYVRAVVESSAAPDRPTRESLVKKAWVQPVTPRNESP